MGHRWNYIFALFQEGLWAGLWIKDFLMYWFSGIIFLVMTPLASQTAQVMYVQAVGPTPKAEKSTSRWTLQSLEIIQRNSSRKWKEVML